VKNTMESYTIEEINLIQLCQKKEKNALIKELKECLNYVGADMAEIINNTTNKLLTTPDSEMKRIFDYPAEIFE
jgi:hypothetical protein